MGSVDRNICKSLLILLLLVLCSQSYAQKTAKSYIDSIFVGMLVKDKVLLSTEEKQAPTNKSPYWNGRKSKRAYLTNDDQLRTLLLSNYSPTGLTNMDSAFDNLIYSNKTIGFLGSLIIRNNDISVLHTSGAPILPVLSSKDQLAILSPDVSNYRLNITTNSVFKGSGGIQAEIARNPFVAFKAASSIGKDDNTSSNLSIGVGLFQNQLAKIFLDMKLQNLKPKQFIPLYYVWNLYMSGDIKEGDACINSFRGLCYTAHRIQSLASNYQFNSSVDAKGSISFLSLGGNASADWTQKKLNSLESDVDNIILFSAPTLTPFPKAKEIKTEWDKITAKLRNADPQFETNNVLPYKGDIVLYENFGPLPSDDIAFGNIVIDKEYTLRALSTNKIKMISDLQLDLANSKPQNDNIYTLKIILKGNEDFIKIADNTSPLTVMVPLRIYLNNPIGSDTLDVKYQSFKITADPKPLPFLTDESPLKASNRTNGVYTYSTTINIDPPANSNFLLKQSGADAPSVSDAPSIPGNRTDLKSRFIQFCQIIPNAALANSFKISFNLDSSSFYDYFNAAEALDLKIKFKDQNGAAGNSYLKPVHMNISIPAEVANARLNKAVGSVSFTTNNDLINSIDTSLIIKVGPDSSSSLGAKLTEFKRNGQAPNTINLVEAIKRSTDLIVSPDNKYIISSRYLKKTESVMP